MAMNDKNVSPQVSSDLIQKVLEDEKLHKEIRTSFQSAERALKDIENQGLLDELEALDKVNSDMGAPDEPSCSKNPTRAIYCKKRGRPRKGTTHVPHLPKSEVPSPSGSSSLPKCNARQKRKRQYNTGKLKGITDMENISGVEHTSSIGISKRRRQPKVLDDYVSDFDTSDEEDENFAMTSGFQISNQKVGYGLGRSKKYTASHSMDNEDILSYYLGDFERSFSEPDFSGEFLDQVCESNEDEDINLKMNKTPLGNDIFTDSISKSISTDIGSRDESYDMEDDEDNSLPSHQKEKELKHTVRNQQQQLAVLHQKYRQLLQKLHKKHQGNKVLDLVYGASKLLTEEQLVFLTLQLKSSCKNVQGVRFSAREKVLALAIYSYRPETYKWLQSLLYLPSKLLLDRWLEVIAKNNPDTAKRLIYYIFKKYIFTS